MSSKSVIVIGGGLAGLSAAVALADAGFRVRILERRPYLGGRASSYTLPNGEHVDNCQHVTLGCCTNLEDFYSRAGAADKIAFYDELFFVDSLGRRAIMRAGPLPAPLHLMGSLLLYPSLTWHERHAIGHAMGAIAATSHGRAPQKVPGDIANLSMLDWLRAHGQSPAAIARFWSVVLVSALNEELDRIDARYGLDVFWKAFLANRAGYRVGIPRVPLGELYDGCRAAIERRGGEVSLRAPVQHVLVANDRVAGVEMGYDYEETADYYVLAVPHQAALELLPPHIVAREPAFSNLRQLKTSPITSVHLWFDRAVMSEPFLTLLDRTTQWIFNKSQLSGGYGAAGQGATSAMPRSAQQASRLQPLKAMAAGAYGASLADADIASRLHSEERSASSANPPSGQSGAGPDEESLLPSLSRSDAAPAASGQYLQLVISASYSLVPLSRQEIIGLCLAEVREVLPESRHARVLKATVIKETAATFSPAPGSDRFRPAQQSPIRNLFLAGDWTATGWPATMEGAVRGGYLAAEAVAAAAGQPRKFVVPDLPVEGLSRLL